LLPFTGDDAMNSELHPLFPLITSDQQEDGPQKKKPKKKEKTPWKKMETADGKLARKWQNHKF
jgi:hypothetical protein